MIHSIYWDHKTISADCLKQLACMQNRIINIIYQYLELFDYGKMKCVELNN